MDHIDMKQDKPLKCGVAIKILSVLSLVCIVFGIIPEYFHSAGLLIHFPLVIAPAVLFVIYLFYFYNKPKSTILLAIIFGSFPLRYLIARFYVAIYFARDFFFFVYSLLKIAPFILFVFYIFYRQNKQKAKILLTAAFSFLLLSFLFGLVVFQDVGVEDRLILLIYILALICSLQGFSKKALFIIAMSGLFLSSATSYLYGLALSHMDLRGLAPSHRDFLLSFMGGFGGVYVVNYDCNLIIVIGKILLYTAFLLFGLKNEVSPVALSVSSKKKTIKPKKLENLSPEQALRFLKTSFESGEISEEEYQTRRSEIISKL